jgi:cytochrome c-type biogenesis protein CcmE
MKPRHKRIAFVVCGLAALAVAAGLVLSAFEKNLVFFFTPSQVAANEAPPARVFRIGGLVEPGSLHREPNELTVHFKVTDTAESIRVVYRGLLPDLFSEGKGVVAQGRIGPDGVFNANEVLAKHDENYMPPEAAEALKRARVTSRGADRTLIVKGTNKEEQRR